MNRSVFETLLGAFVLTVAGYFLIYAYQNSDIGRSQGYDLQATFSRVNGLVLGSDVRISGIKVGDVSNLYLDPETFLATITVTLRNSIHVSEDTVAEITTDGLFGNTYVDLIPGGSDIILQPGEHFSYTQAPRTFSELITKFLLSDDKPDGSDDQTAN